MVVTALENGHASTAVGPLEIFKAAGVVWQMLTGGDVEARFEVTTATASGKPVRMSDGFMFKPDCRLRDVTSADLVFISSGGPAIDDMLARNRAVIPFVREMHEAGASIAAVCSGVGVVAESGLLEGRHATTHWSLLREMARRYPTSIWSGNSIITEGPRLYCGGGVYASLDLALHLVEVFADRSTALECAKSLMIEMPRSVQPSYKGLTRGAQSSDPRISRAELALQRGFTRSVVLEDVAATVGMSPRNFIRRFKESLGVSPMQYLQRLRVDLARQLIERGSVNTRSIAEKAGYSDLPHFRRIFKRHTGLSPAEYRRSVGATETDG